MIQIRKYIFVILTNSKFSMKVIEKIELLDLLGQDIINSLESKEYLEKIEKANQENIPLLLSPDAAYELAGRLYAVGVGSPKSE